MSLREFRASWRRLLFFFLCVAIGVGAIVALRSIIQSLRQGLTQRGAHDDRRPTSSCRPIAPGRRRSAPKSTRFWPTHPIVAADRIDRDADDGAGRAGRRRGAHGGASGGRGRRSRSTARSRWPTVGSTPMTCSSGRGALVGPSSSCTLGMSVGDRLIIGGQPFTIRGVIAQEPGRRIGAFSFGARVIVDLEDLRQTGLLGFGSRASYQRLLEGARRRRRSADDAAAAGAARQLRVGAILRVARGRHRRGPRSRRELSEPRRLRDRRARRHRRLERDPRLRAAEDQERRHPEVPRRHRRSRCSRPTSRRWRSLGLPAA